MPSDNPTPLKAYELAAIMLNAIGWNGNDFRLRDSVSLAISKEVERLNKLMETNEKKEGVEG